MAAAQTSSDLYQECLDFLIQEAEYLDDNDMRAWHALFDREVTYEVPIRVTRERPQGAGFVPEAFHMKEDWYSLETRVSRLESDYAWAEDPPSRTRRFVGNVRVRPGENDDEVEVKSNLLMYRGRGDSPSPFLVTAERRDVLRRVGDELRILRRVVLLDQTTLALPNMALFF